MYVLSFAIFMTSPSGPMNFQGKFFSYFHLNFNVESCGYSQSCMSTIGGLIRLYVPFSKFAAITQSDLSSTKNNLTKHILPVSLIVETPSDSIRRSKA